MEFIKSILDWVGRWQVAQSIAAIFKPVWLPIMTALLALGAGYIQRVPWVWVIMGSAVSFMAMAVGLFFSVSYASARTPAHKLRYVNTIVGTDLGSPPNRKRKRASQATAVGGIPQSYLDKVQVGVQLQNTANFPISAFVEIAETEMLDKKPPRTTYPKPSVTITPGNVVNMMDEPIELDGTPCGKMEGVLNIKIKYGRKGKEHFELSFKAKLEVFMRRDGLISAISTGWDSNRLDAIGPPA
jgi:hypothetical protein